MSELYPIVNWVKWPPDKYKAINTGVFRNPKKGEYYLSGAIPEAFHAPNNLSTAFYIMDIVKIETKTVTTIIQP